MTTSGLLAFLLLSACAVTGNLNFVNRAFDRAQLPTYDLTRFLEDSTRCAVVFADHESGKTVQIPDLWKQIWNNASLRYCIDLGADRIVHQRMNMRLPTKITGKLGRMEPETRDFLERKKTLFEETYDEDESSTVSALKTLAKENLNATDTVILLGGFSGRFDRLLANLNALMLANTLLPVPTVALQGKNVITVLPEGDLAIKVDRTMVGGKSGFAPIAQTKTMVSTRGFKWNLRDEEMMFGAKISTSNELESDLLEFNTTAPIVLAIVMKN